MGRKTVKIISDVDADGNPLVTYECEGFEGITCESISDIMTVLGQSVSKETTEGAYTQELPMPLPLNNQE